MAMLKFQKRERKLGIHNGTVPCGKKSTKKIVLLVDSRHKPTSDDINMYNWIKHYNYEVLVVGTKLDKLKRNDINKNKKLYEIH